jgi:hypothetical protein
MVLVGRGCSAPRVCSTVAGNQGGGSGGIAETATCSAWVGHWDKAGEVFVAALAAVVVASGVVAVCVPDNEVVLTRAGAGVGIYVLFAHC